MVKDNVIKLTLITAGLIIMMLILSSNSSTTAKSIGVILSIILIVMGFVVTGPLKKYFEETHEGTLRPSDSGIGSKFR